MPEEKPYNPLDKLQLGKSVADAILSREVKPLPPHDSFEGAGIYAIYYTGNFSPYARIAEQNQDGRYKRPIYVGKAIPKGGRRGGSAQAVGSVLHGRLTEHGDSISRAQNLELTDFACRHLVVDDIWIALGESLLIQQFLPIWNTTLDGFGNHNPGGGRRNQQRSPWDVIHPGRLWAEQLANNKRSKLTILEEVEQAVGGIPDVE